MKTKLKSIIAAALCAVGLLALPSTAVAMEVTVVNAQDFTVGTPVGGGGVQYQLYKTVDGQSKCP